MVKKHLRLAVVATTVATLGTLALAEPIACPPSISVKEALDKTAPEPWAARFDASSRALAGVSFFDGDPNDQRSIAPVRDSPLAGRDRVATWRFGTSSVPVWLVCRYLDSGATLSRPLPTTYRECRATYGAGGIIKAIDCR